MIATMALLLGAFSVAPTAQTVQTAPTAQTAQTVPTARTSEQAETSLRSLPIALTLVAESGFLGVIDHRIAFSDDDSSFRYHEDGGQDVLFPFLRISAEVEVSRRHTAIFLYQPLALETRVKLPDGLEIDGESFSGESVRLLYSFPFYRLSYLYRVAHEPAWSIDLGASLQIRNATTEFEARGENSAGFYRSAGIGLVPLLKARGRYELAGGFWLGLELDGIYAPVSYINGSDNDTVGALLDASARLGYQVRRDVDAFLNVRYLGGGASNEDPDDYAVNWLNVVSVSLGAALRI
jgi:hypothetical protein